MQGEDRKAKVCEKLLRKSWWNFWFKFIGKHKTFKTQCVYRVGDCLPFIDRCLVCSQEKPHQCTQQENGSGSTYYTGEKQEIHSGVKQTEGTFIHFRDFALLTLLKRICRSKWFSENWCPHHSLRSQILALSTVKPLYPFRLQINNLNGSNF